MYGVLCAYVDRKIYLQIGTRQTAKSVLLDTAGEVERGDRYAVEERSTKTHTKFYRSRFVLLWRTVDAYIYKEYTLYIVVQNINQEDN